MTKQILDEHQVLVETLLPTDWTWGCELEGYQQGVLDSGYHYDDYDDDNEDDDYHYNNDDIDYDYLYEDLFSTLMDTLKDNCDKNLYDAHDSNVHEDGSVHNTDTDLGFEWSTPIFKSYPKAFEGFVHTLYDLLKYDNIYTTKDCGFHHHLMYNGMNERDCIWIYCNLAMDEEFIKHSKKFDVYYLESQQWASDRSLKIIRDGILSNNWEVVLTELSTDKYRLFRIHPQGTIEWRGPRDFLNVASLKIIKDFYYNHLQSVIMKFIEYNRSNTLFGTNLSKEDFFNKLTETRKGFIDQKQFGDNEFIINKTGSIYKNKNKNPFIKKKPDLNRIWKDLEEKPLSLSYLIKTDNPVLEKLFANMDWGNRIHLENILSKLKKQNGYLMDPKDFTLKLVKILEKSGTTLSNILSYGLFEYLDSSILSKEMLRNEFIRTGSSNVFRMFAQQATLGEVEHLIYDSNKSVLSNDYLWRDYPELLAEKFGNESVLKYCYFLIKIIYQKHYRSYDMKRTLSVIKNYVIKYGDKEFLTKWNNMAISLTINNDIEFASLIIKLTPEEYVRLKTEFPEINRYLDTNDKYPLEVLNLTHKL